MRGGGLMITKKDFQCFWDNNYGSAPPLGHILRERFSDKWFRIHSLPNSKRYAKSDNEIQIILDRQNSLISDLIGSGQSYLLLFYAMSENATSTRFNHISNTIPLDSINLEFSLPEHYEGEYYLHMGFINKIWEATSIDTYLEKVASDELVVDFDACEYDLYRILIVNIKQNRIIVPYDGGVDIFLNTQNERDFFKSKYKDWLPSHEKGL